MSTSCRNHAFRVRSIEHPDTKLLAELVSTVHAAFATGDRFPGLPIADGAREDAASFDSDLRRGALLWAAFDAAGRNIGSVRAFPGRMSWEIRRMAVHPRARGKGVARVLVRHLEAAAFDRGAQSVRLDAVVERGNPPFYTGLGYLTHRHFASPDKALSEVAMARPLDRAPEALGYPWDGELATHKPGVLIGWYSTKGGTTAVLDLLDADPAPLVRDQAARVARSLGEARFAGADGWPDAGRAELDSLAHHLAARADSARGKLVTFHRQPHLVREYVQPRAEEPRLLALWRALAGR